MKQHEKQQTAASGLCGLWDWNIKIRFSMNMKHIPGGLLGSWRANGAATAKSNITQLSSGLSYRASGGLLAGRRPCPLCLIWTGRGTVDGEITIPNLLYCGNFSYYWQPTWHWTIWGGSPRNYAGRQREQLRAHARTGMGANMLERTCTGRKHVGRKHVGREHVPGANMSGANMYRARTCRAPT
jgi:hypothetical protein